MMKSPFERMQEGTPLLVEWGRLRPSVAPRGRRTSWLADEIPYNKEGNFIKGPLKGLGNAPSGAYNGP